MEPTRCYELTTKNFATANLAETLWKSYASPEEEKTIVSVSIPQLQSSPGIVGISLTARVLHATEADHPISCYISHMDSIVLDSI